MPKIQPQPKVVRDRVEIKLDRDLAQELDRYCKFIQSDRDYVVGQVLKLVFAKDREFREWSATKPPLTPAGTETETKVTTVNGKGAK
jgi:hypothetical protein